MRETWVPFFQDIRNSSMWAYDAETFKVWMTLMSMVDPEGYVCAAIPGIAVASGIPLPKVREAMALFEAPDPDSRSEELEGRRVVKVPRGWRIVNFEAHRDRARAEAEKARKRRWARLNRQGSVDEDEDSDPWTARSETVDASKSESESKSKSPAAELSGEPVLIRFIPEGYTPSEALRGDALAAGVPDLDARIGRLRKTQIGGRYGVRLDMLEDYFRDLLPSWRMWRETEQSKQRQGPAPAEPPKAKAPAVKGMPLWVSAAHAAIATARGLRLGVEVKRFAQGYHLPVDAVHPNLLDEPFRKHLERASPEH